MREPGNTRTRIQDVALELFTEQGYEATSLREIAERLGVTKAALYYHFKTKDDIVASLMDDRVETLELLLDWARAQPQSPAMRLEFVRRYSAELHAGRHHEVMRFLERNQTALRTHPKSERTRDLMIAVMDLLSPPDDPPEVRLKRAMAIFGLHASWFLLRDADLSDDRRRTAALHVALELVGDPPADPVPLGTGVLAADPAGAAR